MKEYSPYQLNRWWSVLYVWQNSWEENMTWEKFFKMRMKMYTKSLEYPYYHYDLETPDEVEMYNSLCHFFKPEQIQVQHTHYVYNYPNPYRLDFAIKPDTVTGTSYTLGIECDNMLGHSTKSDIEKDQIRTDRLKKSSVVIEVKRFRGKDIKANPHKCAKEAFDYYSKIEDKITDELNEQLAEYLNWITEAGIS